MKHILDNNKDSKLVFKYEIHPEDGSLVPVSLKPEDWAHIRHVSGNIYYAYDHADVIGCLYLAKS